MTALPQPAQDQSERLTWLVITTARQLAQGLVNVPVGSYDC